MSPIKMQRLESGIRLVIELFENINSQKIDSIIRLLSDDCILDSADSGPNGTMYTGKAQIKFFYEDLFRNRKGISIVTEEILGFGHRCVTRWRCTWKDENGEETTLRGTDIVREKNDLICEILSYSKHKRSD